MKPPVMLATVYRRAAKVIRERGWTQGEYEADSGCVCLEGAINLACSGKLDEPLGAFPARRYFEEAVDTVRSLHMWNDAEGRTKAQVLAALKRAERKAARERARVRV